MELATSTAGLGLILLLLEARETLGGAHSLCLSFTVRAQASPGQPWCKVQGSVDGKPFLQYDSDSSKAVSLGLLGEKVNNTRPWTDVTQSLEEVGRDVRMVLLVTKLENSLNRATSTMIPGTAQFKTITPIPWVLCVILTCSVSTLNI